MHWFEWLAFGIFTVGGTFIVTYCTLQKYREGRSLREAMFPIAPIRGILRLTR